MDEEAAEKAANCSLPDSHGNLGRRAIGEILERLIEKGFDGYTYDQACADAGYHHSDLRDGEVFDRLPYYGKVLERHIAFGSGKPGEREEKRLGKLANPTVHIALNQLRRVVNEILKTHGAPDEIILELTRDLKNSVEKQREIERNQSENQKANEARRERLAELGFMDNGENRLKLRLWEELNPDDPKNRCCVYSGEPISLSRLFSSEVEIEHVLPFSKTLDNSFGNKTVSLAKMNRIKGNQSPYEAFSSRSDWSEILARADLLHPSKRWRFGPDAMERYDREERDFLDRHLTDSQYIAGISREYLTKVCNPNKVWVTPGRLTAMLRGKWGLNSLLSDHNRKDRTDHRHHAIDAAVIGVTDRGLLNRISRAAGKAEDLGLERILAEMPDPWEGFRQEIKAGLDSIVVSHRPDHGKAGRLHEDTAYGLVADPEAEEGYNLVFRKALSGLNENEIARIRHPHLREELTDFVEAVKAEGQTLKAALAAYSEKTGTRRVRLLKKEKDLVEIADDEGRSYKAYSPGENHRIDIFERPDGSWDGEAVTVFQANAPEYRPAWQDDPDNRLVFSACKNDLLQIDQGRERKIMQVVRLNITAKRFYLVEHQESGDYQKRHDDPGDPFRWLLASFSKLRDFKATKVRVDSLGRVYPLQA